MNIKRIYNLEDVVDVGYTVPIWCDHEAWWSLVGGTLDCQNFNYTDAREDERIKIHVKAWGDIETATSMMLTFEYIAVSYDNIFIGLAIGVDRPGGWNSDATYVTNYPRFQSMIAYALAMYQNKPDNIVGETTKLDDLDGRYGYVIDKRHKFNLRREGK